MPDDADNLGRTDERAWSNFELQLRAHRAYEAQCRSQVESTEVLMNCLDCGEDIPRERQLALPHTRRCVSCAADVERR